MSPLEGRRIRLRALVTAESSGAGFVALGDALLGATWAGIFIEDASGALSSLAVGDEIDLRDVEVAEAEGLTVLLYDSGSDYSVLSSGNEVRAVPVPPSDLSLVAGPERAEKYEGMLVVLYNVNVVARGVPEGPDLYYLASGTDTLLGTDIESGMSAPDSTFFVRKGDCLGFVSGNITERSTDGGVDF